LNEAIVKHKAQPMADLHEPAGILIDISPSIDLEDSNTIALSDEENAVFSDSQPVEILDLPGAHFLNIASLRKIVDRRHDPFSSLSIQAVEAGKTRFAIEQIH
jgi:hypothetical protein